MLTDISCVSDDEALAVKDRIRAHFSDKTSLKRKESVCAKALLCHVLSSEFNLIDFFVDCEENGKPYIVNSGIHFNLSHSENKILCVCGDEQVGCDVELIKTFNEKISRRFFSCAEQQKLNDSQNKETDFTKLWTLKESILKFSGVGISGGLLSYDFSEFLERESFDAHGLHFESRIYEDCVVSICSESNRILQLKADIKDIIKKLKGENHEFNQVY